MSGFETATFRAMATDVDVLAAPALPEGVLQYMSDLFEESEERFSRFRATSELCLINAAAGNRVAASPVFREVLTQAIEAARQSGGLFDPLVLRAVEAAGYRQTIDSVRGSAQVATDAPRTATYAEIEIHDDGTVLIPEGCGLDFGGFVKGWTVDRAEPLMSGCESWVVNAGGDMLARGDGPDGEGWLVGVDDPFAAGSSVVTLSLRDAAVATSSTTKRRWTTQAGVAHHLIDPRTGRPSETDLAAVTVLAGSAAGAEVLAKTLLLLGKQEAHRYAEEHGVPALLIDRVGGTSMAGGIEGHLVL